MLKVTYFYDGTALDVDNIVKPIQDALIGLAYYDDAQVTDVLSRKRNLGGGLNFRAVSVLLAEGLGRGHEFLHITAGHAPNQEVLE